MNRIQIIAFTLLSTLALNANAGRYEVSEVEIEDLGGGSFVATGSLASARFSDNDVEQIGCRLLGIAGALNQVQCGATDSADNSVSCTSTDPFIIEAVQAISAYAWLRIESNEGSCDRLFVSTRSFHIPDAKTQKGSKKSKKSKKHDDDDD